MNILVIGKFYSEGFALHISETLADMGHNIKHFVPGIQQGSSNGVFAHRLNQIRSTIYNFSDGVPSIRSRHMRKLWDITKSQSFDLIISCHDFLWANEVDQLRKSTSAKVVMWFPDALVNFTKGHFMNANYDALFFKDPYIIKALNGILASPVYYLPECFNPNRHTISSKSEIEKKYLCDIATAGNAHAWRVAFYKHLKEYDVKLWGGHPPLWMPIGSVANMYQGEKVLNETKAKAFLGAKIVLNNLHYGEIWGLNVRAFEAAGIGAFQMVDWRPGLSQLFEDGKEIITFTNLDDMHTKIKFYLARPELRKQIADAGKQRAYAEHTYQKRLQILLETVFNGKTGFPLPVLV